MADQPPRNPLALRFRLGPIPVTVEPSFWIIALLFGLWGGFGVAALIWVPIVFFSILAHELGHALAALGLGRHPAIRLYSFGGVTFYESGLSRLRSIAVSVAGPLAGFAAGGVVLISQVVFPARSVLGQQAVLQLLFVNFGWGLFNLLPVLPLDGGHVLLGVLGPKRQRTALLLGGIFGVLVAVGAGLARHLNTHADPLFVVLLFSMLAFRNLQSWWLLGKQPPPDARMVTAGEALQAGWDRLRQGDEAASYRIGQAVLEGSPDPDERNRARDLLAWAAMARGDHRDALKLLERSEPPDAARALTWAMVLDALGEAERAAPYALRSVEVEPSDTAASLAARVLAESKRVPEALTLVDRFGWSRPAAAQAAFGEIAFAQGGFRDAARRYGAAFDLGGAAGDAFNAACSYARAEDKANALAWIERALKAGFDDLGQLRADPDLALLQGDPDLERLLGAVPRA